MSVCPLCSNGTTVNNGSLFQVILCFIATLVASFAAYSAFRTSEHHGVWVAEQLDLRDPIKNGLEALGVGKQELTIKCTDGTKYNASEIVQIGNGAVYVVVNDQLLVIRYSEIASFAVSADKFL